MHYSFISTVFCHHQEEHIKVIHKGMCKKNKKVKQKKPAVAKEDPGKKKNLSI